MIKNKICMLCICAGLTIVGNTASLVGSVMPQCQAKVVQNEVGEAEYSQGIEAIRQAKINCMDKAAHEHYLGEAKEHFDQGKQKGHSLAALELGKLLFQDYNIAGAVECFKIASNAGNREASLLLGRMYLLGQGVLESASKAKKLLQEAAEPCEGMTKEDAEFAQASRELLKQVTTPQTPLASFANGSLPL